jgi:YegS/Rv2252/BmrU family lipid kinase
VRKALLIANPAAGRGSAGRKKEELDRFCSLLKFRGVSVEVRITAGPADAARLAAEAARDGFREVIVAGGDGTVNEALQGLAGSEARLAIWPRGTANVLGRELRLPRQPDKLADVIAAAKTVPICVGCATAEATGARRYFLLMAGIGLDAAIAARVKPGFKRRAGEAAFWYAGVEEFLTWKPSRFQLEVHGKQYPATLAVLGKAPRYGGNLAMTPRARIDRPEFEILVVDSLSRWRFLQLLPSAMFRNIPDGARGVTYLYADQARAAGGAAPVQVDGEVIGGLPVSFTVTPHVIEAVTA